MSSPIALQELFKAGFEDFAIPSYETAPFTTIQNRAKVTRSLKAIAGVERVHVKDINLLQNEFGPNGEQVFEADSKDTRIRFVGNWTQASDAFGSYASSAFNITDFLEITFYGTGLNLLYPYNSTGNDIRSSIDGGAEGSNIIGSQSNVIAARNYTSNQVIPVTSGLTLGWHTVKLRNNSVTRGAYAFGFEILNQRTDLAVYAGAGISNGSFNGLSSLATSAFNDGVVGTRGARVVKYIENGTLKSVVQEVDSSAQYLTSTDHTNEEVVRRINFREFGANRADDFSTANGATGIKAFTLDDGTTSLVTNDVSVGSSGGPDYVGVNTTGGFLTLTFVGTGLDLVSTYTGTSPVAGTLSIDGTTIYTGTFTSFESTSIRTIKIASGLPYGTHTFRYAKTAAGSGLGIGDFIIYQPKKPSIPVGSIEVADYNLMSDFVYNGSTSVDIMSQGILRKQNMREYIYVGTWVAPVLSGSYMSGWATSSSTAGSYFEYTFFGTGVVYRFGNNTGAQSFTVSIDGSTNLSSFTTTLTATAGLSFTASTGVVTGSPAAGVFANSLGISGLPLGVHKIRVAYTSGATIGPHGTEVITPIHINNPTLKVGSQSLKSVTKYSPEKSVSNAGPDLSKAKAWVYYDFATQRIISSYNVSSVLKISTGRCNVFFEKPFKNENYICSGMAENVNIEYDRVSTSSSANRVDIWVSQAGTGTYTDSTFTAVFFGELIDE